MERSYYAMPFAERYIWGATAQESCAYYMSGFISHDPSVLTELAIFLIPFVAYALFLIATRSAYWQHPPGRRIWSPNWCWDRCCWS